jgi:hypothetical protein
MAENIIATSCRGDDLLPAMHPQDDAPCQMSNAEGVTTRVPRMTWGHPAPRIASGLRYGLPAGFFGLKPGVQALAGHCAPRRVATLGPVAQALPPGHPPQACALSTPVPLGDVECGAQPPAHRSRDANQLVRQLVEGVAQANPPARPWKQGAAALTCRFLRIVAVET